MINQNSFIKSIFAIQSESDFNQVALSVFSYQYEHVAIYKAFCDALGRTTPKHYTEIPFLPISFFKTHRVLSDEISSKHLLTFKSSGTTQSVRSYHYIADADIYIKSFMETFSHQISKPEDSIIMALLPNYLEQGDSSLIYMVDYLIKKSNHSLSGFYLSNLEQLIIAIKSAKKENKSLVLFGVSYALLDLAEKNVDFSGVTIIETGGMKGRRKEMIKTELHEVLSEGLNVPHIFSEYGMTELLSQAYSAEGDLFTPPKWMRISMRDINDPLHLLAKEKTGGVNVIDLANFYSCSFIATDDLGVQQGSKFKILGRFDQSDIRGCNLLVN